MNLFSKIRASFARPHVDPTQRQGADGREAYEKETARREQAVENLAGSMSLEQAREHFDRIHERELHAVGYQPEGWSEHPERGDVGEVGSDGLTREQRSDRDEAARRVMAREDPDTVTGAHTALTQARKRAGEAREQGISERAQAMTAQQARQVADHAGSGAGEGAARDEPAPGTWVGTFPPPPRDATRACDTPGCAGVLAPIPADVHVDEGDGGAMVGLACEDCGGESVHYWTPSDSEYAAVFGHRFGDDIHDDDVTGCDLPGEPETANAAAEAAQTSQPLPAAVPSLEELRREEADAWRKMEQIRAAIGPGADNYLRDRTDAGDLYVAEEAAAERLAEATIAREAAQQATRPQDPASEHTARERTNPAQTGTVNDPATPGREFATAVGDQVARKHLRSSMGVEFVPHPDTQAGEPGAGAPVDIDRSGPAVEFGFVAPSPSANNRAQGMDAALGSARDAVNQLHIHRLTAAHTQSAQDRARHTNRWAADAGTDERSTEHSVEHGDSHLDESARPGG